MSEPTIVESTIYWYKTAEVLPDKNRYLLVVLQDGNSGRGMYYGDTGRGWEFNGSSGGSQRMIAFRTPVWWAYWPRSPEVPA